MRRISYGINTYHKTASFFVEYAHPLIFALDRITEFICGYLIPSLPLPNFRIMRDGEKTTIKEYYGSLQDLFHCFVHCPIFRYCDDRIDTRAIKVSYSSAKKAFYDKDKKFWDEQENEKV